MLIQDFLILFIVAIDFGELKSFFTIEEIFIVGIIFFVIYLRGFSEAID